MSDAAPPACELCGRSGLKLTRHHLIPRSRHKKPRTRRTHDRSRQELNEAVAWLCTPCHKTVHATLSEQELAEAYYTIEALRSHPDLQRFARWCAKQPVGRRIAVKRPARR